MHCSWSQAINVLDSEPVRLRSGQALGRNDTICGNGTIRGIDTTFAGLTVMFNRFGGGSAVVSQRLNITCEK